MTPLTSWQDELTSRPHPHGHLVFKLRGPIAPDAEVSATNRTIRKCLLTATRDTHDLTAFLE
jgi:hypothetical protein